MPLIIITGLPTSGKSTRARQLHDYLAERIASSSSSSPSSNLPSTSPPTLPAKAGAGATPSYRLHLISDDTASGLGRSWRAAYDLDLLSAPGELSAEHVRSANAREKDARAAVYGAVKRALSPRDLVVLDGLNYIKGWRYQLFCEAKNAGTPSVVLQVGCGIDRAREANERRLGRKRRREEEGGREKGGRTAEEEEEEGVGPGEGADGGTRTGAAARENSGQDGQPAPLAAPPLLPPPPAPTSETAVTTPNPVDAPIDSPNPTNSAHTPSPNDASIPQSTLAPAIENTTIDVDDDEEPYTPSNWQNLVARYEEPNPLTRWDSPLFALAWDDGPDEARHVFDQVWDRVAGASRPARIRPNQAAAAPRQYHQHHHASSTGGATGGGNGNGNSGGDYLYALERETQDVVRRVLEAQARADQAGEGGGGGQVRVARKSGGGGGVKGAVIGLSASGRGGGSKHDTGDDDDDDDDNDDKDDNDDLIIELPASRKVGLAQLQRHRRAFVALNRGGMGLEAVGPMSVTRTRESFVGFLNDSFEADG